MVAQKPRPPQEARGTRGRRAQTERQPQRPKDIEWGTVVPPLPPLRDADAAAVKRSTGAGRRAQAHDKPWVQQDPATKARGRPPQDVLKLLGDNIKYLRDELKAARRKEKRRITEHAAEMRQKDLQMQEMERCHRDELRSLQEEIAALKHPPAAPATVPAAPATVPAALSADISERSAGASSGQHELAGKTGAEIERAQEQASITLTAAMTAAIEEHCKRRMSDSAEPLMYMPHGSC